MVGAALVVSMLEYATVSAAFYAESLLALQHAMSRPMISINAKRPPKVPARQAFEHPGSAVQQD